MLDMNKYGRAEGDVQMQQKRVYMKYVVCMTLSELTLSMKLMKGCISPSKLHNAVMFVFCIFLASSLMILDVLLELRVGPANDSGILCT